MFNIKSYRSNGYVTASSLKNKKASAVQKVSALIIMKLFVQNTTAQHLQNNLHSFHYFWSLVPAMYRLVNRLHQKRNFLVGYSNATIYAVNHLYHLFPHCFICRKWSCKDSL